MTKKILSWKRPWKITIAFNIYSPVRIYHLESRWHNSHVLVYHGPLLSHLLGVAPSTFTMVYVYAKMILFTGKSWFEVITYSHNCDHNSDLWQRAGLHNVCCFWKTKRLEPSDHHPNIHQTKNLQTNHQQEVLWAWRADFFLGAQQKKQRSSFRAKNSIVGTAWFPRLLQLVTGFMPLKNRKKGGMTTSKKHTHS